MNRKFCFAIPMKKEKPKDEEINMKNKKKKKKARIKNNNRLSIRSQISMIFIGLMALIVLVCWVINSTYLEKYYLWKKEKALYTAYESFDEATNKGTLNSDTYNIEWQRICNKYNINVIILDADSKTVKTSGDDGDFLMHQLMDNFFGTPENRGYVKVIRKANNYEMQIVRDPRMKTEYLELWGTLDNGNPFLIRTAMESIKDSVKISNQFLIYAGLFAVLLGSFIIGYASKKIALPILKLAKISERMTHLDFEAKYEGRSTKEIALLGRNINELSAALEETISELKTANNELHRDIEKKEKIDEMRREFLSNVSHELKTPIALIQGYAEGLKEEINEDAESREFYCDVIIDESAKMNTLVKKLLTLNQLEFGNDPVKMDRFDIAAMVKNYLQTADILIRQNNAKVCISDCGPLFVWADEFKVEEVIMNYFSNALNHLSGERIIEVKITVHDQSARVSVFNTGEPIPEEALPHLWEKFYKVDKARTREYGGSGVGLSIVKAIMDSFHQNYGVTNFDNGVEFWMELDMCKEIEAEQQVIGVNEKEQAEEEKTQQTQVNGDHMET